MNQKKIIFSHLLLTNVGCEIILRGTIKFLEEVLSDFKLEFFIPSYDPARDKNILLDINNITIIPMLERKKYIRAILRKTNLFTKYWTPRYDSSFLKNADLFVSVGGDIYTIDFNQLPLDWIGSEIFATRNGVPSLMFGANMENFEKLSLQNKNKLIDHLKRFKTIAVRDADTKKYLNENTVQKNVEIYPDPIFSIRKKIVFERKIVKIIGVNFTPILIRDFGIEIIGRYTEIIEQLIDAGYEIRLIPHVYDTNKNPGLDDRIAIQKLLDKISLKNINKIQTITSDFTFDSISKEINKIDLFIGARMHGCLNSLTQGKPVIFISYSKKAQTMVNWLKNESPFSVVKNNLTSIPADRINADYIFDFIKKYNEWSTNEESHVEVNMNDYLKKLPLRNINILNRE